jgi:hypothetical protein
MPRERVLDALLDGLANDMIAYRAPWHTKRAGGDQRLASDAFTERAEDPVEVRDRPGVQVRKRDRLAFVRVD